MNMQAIHLSQQLVHAVPLLGNSHDRKDYDDALELVEYLVEHDPDNPLVEMLCARIDRFEEHDPRLAAFNARLKEIPPGVGILRTLIDQYQLTLSDFENEIGKKSLVSRILSGERKLTIAHIRALSRRFNVPVGMFIEE